MIIDPAAHPPRQFVCVSPVQSSLASSYIHHNMTRPQMMYYDQILRTQKAETSLPLVDYPNVRQQHLPSPAGQTTRILPFGKPDGSGLGDGRVAFEGDVR
jgi:hypothetical protein